MRAGNKPCHNHGEETRRHKRLMKRSSQLDWNDLQEIAKMKGIRVLGAFVEEPANAVGAASSDAAMPSTPSHHSSPSSGVAAEAEPAADSDDEMARPPNASTADASRVDH